MAGLQSLVASTTATATVIAVLRSHHRAFPLARLRRAIGAVVIIVVVIAVGSIATAAAARHYEWRVFVFLVSERRKILATEFTHFAPPISRALAAVTDLL
jgi:hypothetical protein